MIRQRGGDSNMSGEDLLARADEKPQAGKRA
jgi:hypothetical protein